MIYDNIEIRGNLKEVYADVLTSEVLSALSSLSHFNKTIKEVMTSRINRRAERFQRKKRRLRANLVGSVKSKPNENE